MRNRFCLTTQVQFNAKQSSQILFANKHDIPFIAKAGGHGAVTSLLNFENGIQISMSRIHHVTMSPNGKTAKIGGGIKAKELMDTLWDVGKQTGGWKA